MTDDKLFERRAILRGAALATLAAPFAAKAALAADTTPVIYNSDARIALRMLERHPYTSVGRGMPVYVFVSARCPYCQVMYRRYPGAVPNVELRYIADPLNQAETGEVIKVWQARTPAVFNAYMQHRLVGTPQVTAALASEYRRGPMPPSPNNLPAYSGFWLDNMSEVISRFQATYPKLRFGGTPSFFMPGEDAVFYLSGNDMMDVVIGVARGMKGH